MLKVAIQQATKAEDIRQVANVAHLNDAARNGFELMARHLQLMREEQERLTERVQAVTSQVIDYQHKEEERRQEQERNQERNQNKNENEIEVVPMNMDQNDNNIDPNNNNNNNEQNEPNALDQLRAVPVGPTFLATLPNTMMKLLEDHCKNYRLIDFEPPATRKGWNKNEQNRYSRRNYL